MQGAGRAGHDQPRLQQVEQDAVDGPDPGDALDDVAGVQLEAVGGLPNQRSTLRRAWSAKSGRRSKECSRPPGASAWSRAIDRAPEPVPASTTVMPGWTSAAITIRASTWGR